MKRSATRLRAVRNERTFLPAAAIYSVRLFDWPARYTVNNGPLLRVRRSSDNTEQDIYPAATADANGNRFIDTTALATFVGSGNGFVSICYDQSGWGRHATQTDVNKQPRIVQNGVVDTQNGKPAIKFENQYWLNVTSTVVYGAATTFNMVCFPSPVGSQDYIVSGSGTRTNNFAIISGYATPIEYFQGYDGVTVRGTLEPNQEQTIVSVTTCDGARVYGYRRGSQVFDLAAGKAVAGGALAQIGAVTSQNLFAGNLQEMTIFPFILQNEYRLKIERSQGLAFGITVA